MQHVPFSIARDEQSGVITVAGDIEEAHLDALADAVEAQQGPVTVDLSAVTYLPSYVLGALAVLVRDADADAASGIEIVAAAGSIAASVLAVVAIPHRLT